jgi:putative FmdB family regulatory protein
VPTYEYKCTSCEHRYELKEGFDAPPRQACPVCGSVAKRVLFPPPIVFKGKGFYVTDSRKSNSSTVGAADIGGGGTPGSAEGAKKENGAASTPEPSAAPAPAASSDSSSSAS